MRLRTLTLLIVCVAAFAATSILLATSNSMASFGVNEVRLKQALFGSLTYGHAPIYPDAKLYYAATPGERTAFATNTVLWVRAYLESAEFKSDYAKQRENNKPRPPVSKGTPDEQFLQYKLQQQKNLDDFKARMEKMKADMQKSMEPALKVLEDNAQKAKTDPKLEATMKRIYEQQAVAEQKSYEDRLARFEKRYPEDPKTLVADRLREFLDISKDIPFDAKLVPSSNGKLSRFADREYEHKSEEWKLCFRAGKEPVAAARAVAADWLQQLEKK